MLLKDKETGVLLELKDIQALIDPSKSEVLVQSQNGEEEQDPELIQKSNLIFPSHENLPQCWLDANYRNT